MKGRVKIASHAKPRNPRGERSRERKSPRQDSRRSSLWRWLAIGSMALAVLVLTVPYPMGSIEGLHKDSCKSGHMTQMELHESRKPGPSVRTSLKREVLQRLEGFPLVIRAAMPSGSGPVLRRWACGLMPWGWTWTLCATP
jgi:hypothetical protein